MHDLTGFQRDLMFLIAGFDEPKGVDVNDEIEQYYDTDIMNGRLYPNLDRLVNKGLVEKGQHDNRTNKYMLTDRGKRELEARLNWERQYIPDEIVERVEEAAATS